METKITLHTHDDIGSYDSYTPFRLRAKMYNSMRYGAVAPLGHDNLSDYQDPELLTLNAIEHTASEDPEIHIVELIDHDFKFLAHPARITDDDVKETAKRIIDERDLDGVEKFNNGSKQYEGSIDNTIELSNDDAHNIMQMGTSYMIVEVDEMTESAIMSAIRNSNIELKNRRTRYTGNFSKRITQATGFSKRANPLMPDHISIFR